MGKYNIIFLDFDGVLNTGNYLHHLYEVVDEQHPNERGEWLDKMTRDEFGHLFDPQAVANLEILIKTIKNVKIVISSTWRIDGLERMQEMWKFRSLPGEVIDITPRIYVKKKTGEFISFVPRGAEIEKWLKDNEKKVLNYVIIDDDSDMLDSQFNNFVKTDFNMGFDKIALYDAINILKG